MRKWQFFFFLSFCFFFLIFYLFVASICQHPNLKRGESNLGEDGYQTAELWDFTLSLYQIQLPVSAALPAFPHIVIFTWFFHCSVISKWLGWNASKCLDDVILNNASSLHRRWPSNDGQDKEAYQPEQITRQPIKICSLYHTICIHYRYQRVRKSEWNEWDRWTKKPLNLKEKSILKCVTVRYKLGKATWEFVL